MVEEVDAHLVVVVEVAQLVEMEVLVLADLHLMTVREVLVIDMVLQVVYLLQMVEAISICYLSAPTNDIYFLQVIMKNLTCMVDEALLQ